MQQIKKIYCPFALYSVNYPVSFESNFVLFNKDFALFDGERIWLKKGILFVEEGAVL